jgi:DNA-binding Lrp family transcriptional regulator
MKRQKEFIPDFLLIPYAVMHMNSADRFIFGTIYMFSQLSQKKCFASNTAISKIAHVTPETVSNSLIRLEEQGFIKRYFKDTERRNRDYIECLVGFSKVSSVSGLPIIPKLNEVSSIDEHIYNKDKEYDIQPKSESTQPSDIFNSKEEIEKMRSSPQEWLSIIGEFARRKKLHERYTSKKQLQVLIGRYIKVARKLATFDRKQLREVFDKCAEMRDQHGREIEWTLETALKQLTK